LNHVRVYLIGLTLLFSPLLQAQMNVPSGPRPIKYQFMVFGVISAYQNDPRISSNTHSGQGLGANVRAEIPVIKGVKFLVGAEILTQSISFDSYYFGPGYSFKFDGNEMYNHSIRTTEVGLPLLFKVNWKKKEEVYKTNMYFLFGWEPKYTLFAHSTVTSSSDGSLVSDNNIKLPYENQFLGTNVGNYIDVGFGFNRNFLPGHKSIIFECCYRYGLSRYVYEIGQGHDILYLNTNFSIGLGYRF
jgi:hypothetical protein